MGGQVFEALCAHVARLLAPRWAPPRVLRVLPGHPAARDHEFKDILT